MSKLKQPIRQKRTLSKVGEKAALRVETKGNKRFFVGYAAVFNQRSRLIWDWWEGFFEEIRTGAFDAVLESSPDVVLRVDHLAGSNLGRTISGALTLEVDEIGLKFRAEVPDTREGNDTYVMVERGDYTDCSFAFNIEESGEEWLREDDNTLVHICNTFSRLIDVTICTYHGAYEPTEIAVETAKRMLKELDFDVEERSGEGEGEQGIKPKTSTIESSQNEEAAEKERIAFEDEQDELHLDIMKAKL